MMHLLNVSSWLVVLQPYVVTILQTYVGYVPRGDECATLLYEYTSFTYLLYCIQYSSARFGCPRDLLLSLALAQQ